MFRYQCEVINNIFLYPSENPKAELYIFSYNIKLAKDII